MKVKVTGAVLLLSAAAEAAASRSAGRSRAVSSGRADIAILSSSSSSSRCARALWPLGTNWDLGARASLEGDLARQVRTSRVSASSARSASSRALLLWPFFRARLVRCSLGHLSRACVICVSTVRGPLAWWIDQTAPADYFRLEGSLPWVSKKG